MSQGQDWNDEEKWFDSESWGGLQNECGGRRAWEIKSHSWEKADERADEHAVLHRILGENGQGLLWCLPAASSQLWSGNRYLQRPGLPLPAAQGLPPLHSLFVTQKYEISHLISRQEDKNNFAGSLFFQSTSQQIIVMSWIPQTHLLLYSFSPPFSAWDRGVCARFCPSVQPQLPVALSCSHIALSPLLKSVSKCSQRDEEISCGQRPFPTWPADGSYCSLRDPYLAAELTETGVCSRWGPVILYIYRV